MVIFETSYCSAKTQMENNKNLTQQIQFDLMSREMLRNKLKYSGVLEGVLLNNLSEEEVKWVYDIEKILHLFLSQLSTVVWNTFVH